MDAECCKNLCIAVIKQAMNDYMEGLTYRRLHGTNHHFIHECEDFFTSEWFDFYKLGIEIDGKTMIRILKKRCGVSL